MKFLPCHCSHFATGELFQLPSSSPSLKMRSNTAERVVCHGIALSSASGQRQVPFDAKVAATLNWRW
jgi:hypothetical protein